MHRKWFLSNRKWHVKTGSKFLWPKMTFMRRWMWFWCFIWTFACSKASKTTFLHIIFPKCHLWHRKWPKFTSDILKWSLKWFEGTGIDFRETGSDIYKPEVKFLWPEITFISHWMWFWFFILTFACWKASKTTFCT